jgi:uncharacterized membrane protein (DUF2068 family)
VSDASAARRPGDTTVTLIGVFKLVKTTLLVVVGVLALTGGSEGVAHDVARFTRWTGAFSGHEVVQRALAKLLSLDVHMVHRLGVASLVYAVVFATEGVGLVRRRRWAEWLTVGVTSSFVPLEVYELVRHPGPGKVVAIALNVAIAVYLVWRLVVDRRPKLSI